MIQWGFSPITTTAIELRSGTGYLLWAIIARRIRKERKGYFVFAFIKPDSQREPKT